MHGKRPTIRSTVGDNKPNPNSRRNPSAIPYQPIGEPPLPVKSAHRLIQVDELGLELDDQEAPRCRMPGKDIDDPSLAVDGERDLGLAEPRPVGQQVPSHRLVHGRMPRVEQSAEVATLPPDGRVVSPAEGIDHAPHVVHTNQSRTATLDATDHLARHVRPGSHVFLTPSPSNAEGANRGADLSIVHNPGVWQPPLGCHVPPSAALTLTSNVRSL